MPPWSLCARTLSCMRVCAGAFVAWPCLNRVQKPRGVAKKALVCVCACPRECMTQPRHMVCLARQSLPRAGGCRGYNRSKEEDMFKEKGGHAHSGVGNAPGTHSKVVNMFTLLALGSSPRSVLALCGGSHSCAHVGAAHCTGCAHQPKPPHTLEHTHTHAPQGSAAPKHSPMAWWL